MPAVIRRGLGLTVVASLGLLLAGPAHAATPEGPQLSLMRWSTKPFDLALLTVDPSGKQVARVVGGNARKITRPLPFSGGSWSPDGALLAYGGVAKGKRSMLYLVAADGSGLRPVPGTAGARHPVFSPDGRTVAFSRTRFRQSRFDPKHPLSILRGGYDSTTAWLIDLSSGQQRRLTNWKNGLHIEPSSFSPDGASLAVSMRNRRVGEARAIQLSDGTSRLIARQAEEPVYSPDGSRIAFISYRDGNLVETGDEPMLASELYTIGSDRTGLKRVTNSPRWHEASPSWDPSGQRLAYTQTTGREFIALGFTNIVMQVNADGSCPKAVFGKHRNDAVNSPGIYGPAWRPGPGREAGPIAC